MRNFVWKAAVSGLLLLFAAEAMAESPKNKASIVWVNEQPTNLTALPPGTSHRTFVSKRVGKEVGYCVYLPPHYKQNAAIRFPVIYNLHGNGGNEFTSIDSIALLHSQIVSGKTPPMIMVLPNGGHSTFYKNSADGQFPMESIFMEELIPHIDSEFRTIAGREGRCIEGFSMGGRGSARLAMKYPEMFCSLFCQAGNVPRLLEAFDGLSEAERATSLLGPDREAWAADDVYVVTSKNLQRIKANVRIQIACGTKDDGHLKTVRDFHQHLLELGVDHTYIELEDLGHKRAEMMARLGDIWFDYHVESLRRVGAWDRNLTGRIAP